MTPGSATDRSVCGRPAARLAYQVREGAHQPSENDRGDQEQYEHEADLPHPAPGSLPLEALPLEDLPQGGERCRSPLLRFIGAVPPSGTSSAEGYRQT